MTDIVERLRWLSSPSGEHMGDGQRITAFCASGNEAADEIEKLRAALQGVVYFEVFGFGITDTRSGRAVFCEGTDRFVREDDVVKMRRIARAALGKP